jgi:ProP effector
MISRRDRIAAAAAAAFRPKGPASSIVAVPVPPTAMPKLSLKLKMPGTVKVPSTVTSSTTPAAGPPAGARTGKAKTAPAVGGTAKRPPGAAMASPAAASQKKPPTPPKTWTISELRTLVEWMRSQWPAAFAEEPLRPLAVGAGAVIARARPQGKTHSDIRAALRLYVGSDPYLEALAAEGTHRIGLDGSDAGEVEESHRLHAREQLAERQAKRREPKGA